MLYDRSKLEVTARQYALINSLSLEQTLGFGLHGIVFSTSRKSAIKVHALHAAYIRERNVYLRLEQLRVTQVRGFTVPQLLRFDDALGVIEMGIVTPPFLLDFAAAYLDAEPEFSPETLADWTAEKREQFEDRWPEVQAVLRELRHYRIYQTDVSPGNIRFRD